MSEFILEIFLILILAVGGLAGMLWLDAVKCRAQWGQSGMQVEWQLFAGCLVQTADGRWIPAASYRELP